MLNYIQSIETITVENDTVINNTTYAKLSATKAEPCSTFSQTEFLREEGDKIFRYNQQENAEFLMIDFGETNGYELIYFDHSMNMIDTGMVLVDSFGIEYTQDGTAMEVQYMRIYNNSSYEDDAVYTVYKNIGFVNYGLLFPNLGTGLCDALSAVKLRCFISGQDTIHFTEFDCSESSIIDATKESTLDKVTVFPNPASDNIHIPENFNVVGIINASGQNQVIDQIGDTINVNSLPSGLYVIQLSSRTGKEFYFQKFMKVE